MKFLKAICYHCYRDKDNYLDWCKMAYLKGNQMIWISMTYSLQTDLLHCHLFLMNGNLLTCGSPCSYLFKFHLTARRSPQLIHNSLWAVSNSGQFGRHIAQTADRSLSLLSDPRNISFFQCALYDKANILVKKALAFPNVWIVPRLMHTRSSVAFNKQIPVFSSLSGRREDWEEFLLPFPPVMHHPVLYHGKILEFTSPKILQGV